MGSKANYEGGGPSSRTFKLAHFKEANSINNHEVWSLDAYSKVQKGCRAGFEGSACLNGAPTLLNSPEVSVIRAI